MSTSVPSVSLSPNGYVAPAESAILSGVQADINAAFGGNLNFNTDLTVAGTVAPPQVLLSVSETTIIGNTNNLLLSIFNGVDPAYAAGRMQDAIGRIYFLSRIASAATVVQCTCTGQAGVTIPVDALAVDTLGNIYSCQQSGTIPVGGSVVLPFANNVQGAIACPAGTLTTIYKAVNGWDTINNLSDGAEGRSVESRQQFETRRQQSVAGNSINTTQAVAAAVLNVPNVLGVYAQDNFSRSPIAINPGAVVVGSISGTSLTVSSVLSGAVEIGQTVSGEGVTYGTTIVGGVSSPYTVSVAQTVSSTNLSLGGVSIKGNTLYVSVSGGASQSVAKAIFSKKPPGCGLQGNTTEVVYDDSQPYVAPGIPYSITYESPDNVEIYFNVSIVSSTSVPSNAAQLIQNSIINAFIGNDGGLRMQMGTNIIASRFYPGIYTLGPWATITALTLGSSAAPDFDITASISGLNMTVSATGGTIAKGQVLVGAGVVAGTRIVSQSSGSAGSTGVYVVSNTQTVSSETIHVVAMTDTSIQMQINQMPVTATANISTTLS
jgi:hypothetical protein